MTIETIHLNPQVADIGSMPLITDVQYLEPFSSQALNRKFSGIVRAGIFRGFHCSPSGTGLTLTISHLLNQSGEAVTHGVALVERNDYALTVRQQKEIQVELVAGQKSYVVLEAFYEHGVTTKQVDMDAAQDAANVSVITEAELQDFHVILCTATIPEGETTLTVDHLSFVERTIGGAGVEEHEHKQDPHPQYVMKTDNRLAMLVPVGSDESEVPPDGLQRWNPIKKRMENSKGGKWNGMGGGGSTITVIDDDISLDSGSGCLVKTDTAQKQVIVTLSASPSEGDEHIVGDKGYAAYSYPIKVLPERSGGETTTIDGEDELIIDVDGARVTLNYNAVDDNWELSSGFGERSAPKAIYDRYESYPDMGTTLFSVPYSVGYLDVLVNGVEVAHSDVTATDGQNILLHKPTKFGDVVVIKAYRLTDKIEDIVYTRKEWSGSVLLGEVSLPATGLENDIAKAYRLVIGGVIQIPTQDYTVSSATNEILLTEPSDGNYDWYLLAEAQVTLFQAQDSEITTDNTNNSLTGTNVKENFDELDAKVEALPTISNPNLFINGCFSINQRGHAGSLTTNSYTIDRWLVRGSNSTGGVVNVDQAYVDGVGFAMQIETAGATSYVAWYQPIEDSTGELQRASLNGGVFTLSFDIKGTHASEAFDVTAFWKDITNDAESDIEIVASGEITDALSRKVFTISLPALPDDYDSSNDYALVVRFATQSQAVDSVRIFANAKFERGDKATPFVPDDVATNLAKCQQYYELVTAAEVAVYQSSSFQGGVEVVGITPRKRNPAITILEQNGTTNAMVHGVMKRAGLYYAIRFAFQTQASNVAHYFYAVAAVDSEL